MATTKSLSSSKITPQLILNIIIGLYALEEKSILTFENDVINVTINDTVIPLNFKQETNIMAQLCKTHIDHSTPFDGGKFDFTVWGGICAYAKTDLVINHLWLYGYTF